MRHPFSKKRSFILLFIFIIGISSGFSKFEHINKEVTAKVCSIYDELQLSQLGLSRDIFDRALTGWNTLSKANKIENTDVLTIADLSQSSNAKRLYVIDMAKKKVLFNTYVAHGRNSGDEFASSFSNKLNSFQTSLGFYLTEATYAGAHGLSLKLKGIEKGINDIAEDRGIVMHGAAYVCESFINQFGRLGRSQGCPAVPEELCKPIINSIKGGSCLFMYSPDKNYLRKSHLV